MTSREKLLRKPIYWFDHEQNELFRQVTSYMERQGMNRTELATMLQVDKSYVSQILNGNFNYTLKKLIELSLAIGLVPQISYTPIEAIIEEDAEKETEILNEINMFSDKSSNSEMPRVTSSFGDGLSVKSTDDFTLKTMSYTNITKLQDSKAVA